MNRPRTGIFLIMFFLSLLLFFFRYSRLLTFDADQEFYAGQYLQIFQEHNLTLVGIRSSVGNLFVGPLYTYLSAIIYLVFKGSPDGIFLFTLLFSSLSAGLTYWIFTLLKDEKTGLFGGFLVLYSGAVWQKAFSPSVINLLYPMGVMFFYCLCNLSRSKKFFYWLVILLGLSFHIHVSLILYLPIIAVCLLTLRQKVKITLAELLFAFLILLIFLSPLIFFDIRHHFYITRNLYIFLLTGSGNGTKITILTFGSGLWRTVLSLTNTFSVSILPNLHPAFLIPVLVFYLVKIKKNIIYNTISAILAVSAVLLSFYRGPLPDYYLYFLLPVFLFTAADFLGTMIKNRYLLIPVTVLLIFVFSLNTKFMSRTVNPYNYFLKVRAVKYISEKTAGKPVKILYDTYPGLGFGFPYLLNEYKVNTNETTYTGVYQIIIRSGDTKPGVFFHEDNLPVGIKVARLPDHY